MHRERIASVLAHGTSGATTTVCGWIRSKREAKMFAFLVLGDGSTQDTLQVIVDAGTAPFEQLTACATGAAISVKGILRDSRVKAKQLNCWRRS